MIPNEKQCYDLWDKYKLPPEKRIHCRLVAKVALKIADKCKMYNVQCTMNVELLQAAALLHDIDKKIEKIPGEQHPDAGVRILIQEGMGEVAALVKNHPLHCILDPKTVPQMLEEKILFLADKMVKYEIIGVDKRFQLWQAEDMTLDVNKILDLSYPKVKELSTEILDLIKMTETELIASLKSS
jgi:putative nucleotidyltransferase with HDIG domain